MRWRAFNNDPFDAVAWMDGATATDYATFAPLVMRHAGNGDPVARRIVRDAGEQIDELVRRLFESGASRIALLGGSHRRCSRGCHLTSSGGWFRSRVTRWTALCISPAAGIKKGSQAMPTEHISPRYVDLDTWSTAEIIAAMYEGQLAAAAAVRGALGAIGAAVDDAVPALQRGGRIVYVGAGTSGRIGLQDGTELTPNLRLALRSPGLCHGRRHGCADQERRKCRRQ